MCIYVYILFFFKAWFPTHWFWGLTLTLLIHNRTTHTYCIYFKGQILKIWWEKGELGFKCICCFKQFFAYLLLKELNFFSFFFTDMKWIFIFHCQKDLTLWVMTSIVYKNTQLYNFYQIQRYALVCYNLFVFQDKNILWYLNGNWIC